MIAHPFVYRLQNMFAQLFHNHFLWGNNKNTCHCLSSLPSIKTPGTFWSPCLHPRPGREWCWESLLAFPAPHLLIHKILTHFPGDLRGGLALEKCLCKEGYTFQSLIVMERRWATVCICTLDKMERGYSSTKQKPTGLYEKQRVCQQSCWCCHGQPPCPVSFF